MSALRNRRAAPPGHRGFAWGWLSLAVLGFAGRGLADPRNLGAAKNFERIEQDSDPAASRELLLKLAGGTLVVGSLVLAYRQLRADEDREGRPKLPDLPDEPTAAEDAQEPKR